MLNALIYINYIDRVKKINMREGKSVITYARTALMGG
jgi:hypothetical protein